MQKIPQSPKPSSTPLLHLKGRWWLVYTALVSLMLFCSATSYSQAVIRRQVIANAGGTSTSAQTTIRGTVSQTAIGRIAPSNTQHNAGFWYGVQSWFSNNNFAALIVIPKVTGSIGNTVSVPLILQQSKNLLQTSARNFEAVVRFNATMLEPSQTQGYRRTGDIGELTVTGATQDSAGVLATMNFTAKLGNAETTAMEIVSFRWLETSRVNINTVHGEVALDGYCRNGDTVRLIKRGITAGIIKTYPNPAREFITLSCLLSEHGETEITLVDVTGKLQLPLTTINAVTGEYTLTLELPETLANGAYFLNVRTPSELFSTKCVVNR